MYIAKSLPEFDQHVKRFTLSLIITYSLAQSII